MKYTIEEPNKPTIDKWRLGGFRIVGLKTDVEQELGWLSYFEHDGRLIMLTGDVSVDTEHNITCCSPWIFQRDLAAFDTMRDANSALEDLPPWAKTRLYVKLDDFWSGTLFECSTGEQPSGDDLEACALRERVQATIEELKARWEQKHMNLEQVRQHLNPQGLIPISGDCNGIITTMLTPNQGVSLAHPSRVLEDMNDSLTIMTYTHPQWVEFIDRLAGPEGINFQEDPQGKAHWKCRGGRDQGAAFEILNRMGGINVSASLEWMRERGGYCDCEILWNVA